MNILYTFNDGFVPQVCASIASVCENNKKTEKIIFYLMTLEVSKDNQKILSEFIQSYGRNVYFIELKNIQQYFDFKINIIGWNPIVLARLLVDKLLPNSLEKILYLDGDTIVRGSLEELWHICMDKYSIAASLEPTYSREKKSAIKMEGYPYYNAGVLLINLNKWREDNIGEKIISYYRKYDGKLFSNDQDAINGSQKGKILTISPKYNFFNIYDQYPYWFLKKLCDYSYIDKNVYKDAKNNPIIIHFLGEERPWRRGNHHRFKNLYDYYLNLTPYKEKNYEDGWRLYFILWDTFNILMKPFPTLRYSIINALIPSFLKYRSKRK